MPEIGNKEIKTVKYRIGNVGGALTDITDSYIFAVRWTLRRGIVFTPGFENAPDYFTYSGQILTYDPDLAIELMDLRPYGYNHLDENENPQLIITYDRKGYTTPPPPPPPTVTIKRQTTFRNIIFGTSPGAQMETLDAVVDKGADSLITIPFTYVGPPGALPSSQVITAAI